MDNTERNPTADEILFYRQMLMETSRNINEISRGWMKSLKIALAIVSITFGVVIISGFFICENIVNKYLAYAYAPDAIEQSNTNTNINKNTNENK
ncbi:hypothetical protein [Clostridium beijerinckii]|uniref:hypothetical protein n=1 Tax=Clostridium beijerinckii TaxID=1520 RepID=UPI00232D6BC0|nr:hypothetical protein [Clostridium beijerinckii]